MSNRKNDLSKWAMAPAAAALLAISAPAGAATPGSDAGEALDAQAAQPDAIVAAFESESLDSHVAVAMSDDGDGSCKDGSCKDGDCKDKGDKGDKGDGGGE